MSKQIKNIFKIEVGTHIKDEKRDLTIIDLEIRERKRNDRKSLVKENFYKFRCNACGYIGWIEEYRLLNIKCGCLCCSGKVLVEGINDIPTVAPWLIPYFQGGYEEAKLYTVSGGCNPNNKNKNIYPICPVCGRIKDKKVKIYDIYRNHSIGCLCSDSISYGEKFVFSILEQLKINFETQLSKTTFKWCDKYRYDFYFEINNEAYICEVHGLQHYEESFRNIKSNRYRRTLVEEQENDKLKKELAIKNGIKEENYIVIDCRYSTLEWIRDNENGILNSKLNDLFDLSIIDWFRCEEYALSNLVKIACEHKRNDISLTTTKIGQIMGYSQGTIITWLKAGNKLKWCHYDAEEELEKSHFQTGDTAWNCKQVEIFKNGIRLGIFDSYSDLERQSKKIFGVLLFASGISKVCKGKLEQYKGYTFKCVEEKKAC